jgi:hypothetical protein
VQRLAHFFVNKRDLHACSFPPAYRSSTVRVRELGIQWAVLGLRQRAFYPTTIGFESRCWSVNVYAEMW